MRLYLKVTLLTVLFITLTGCGGGGSDSTEKDQENEPNSKLVLGESKWGSAKWQSE